MRVNTYLFLKNSDLGNYLSMKTIRKIESLFQFEVNITLDNKIVLIYTLFFPVLFLFLNSRTSPQSISLYSYWAYIIVVGVLNGVISGIINMRENNFLKMFCYIVKSKKYIYFSNVITQTLIIEIELIVFNFVAFFILHNITIIDIMYCLFLSIILIPLCSLFLSFFLLLRIRVNTFNILLNGYLSLMLAMFYVRVSAPIERILLLINPFSYFSYLFTLLTFKSDSFLDLMVLLIFGLIYILIGLKAINIMPIQGITNRY